MYLIYNGKVVNNSSPCINPNSEGLLYGYGLFETLKVHKDNIYFFDEHIDRLRAGCKVLGLNFNTEPSALLKYCYQLLDANQLSNCALRITYFKSDTQCNYIITSRNNPYTRDDYNKGFKLCFTNLRRNPKSILVSVKTNNYLENMLVRSEAKQKGFDETVFLNTYNKISEGTTSNIFFVKNNKLFTPSSECGILPGIIRGKVIEISKKLGVSIEIGHYVREELLNADEIFITNSLLDIMPVSQIETKNLDIGKLCITQLLKEELKKLY
ncbi:MAG: 4-amino-4-deoxychorismate lyase [Firmicutes bacterium]|nr:4-amino-4-deoxychorismate lyase [Bacillota bacterium]